MEKFYKLIMNLDNYKHKDLILKIKGCKMLAPTKYHKKGIKNEKTEGG